MRFLFLLLLCLPYVLGAQSAPCSDGGCIVNAGQDQVICSDGELTLRGENNVEFEDPLDATWTADADNPEVLTIENPNALVTAVTRPGTGYPPGIYNFSLTVTCADGSVSCSETSVTIVELPDVRLIVPEEECSSSVFLVRSGPLPEGVTESLVFSRPGSITVENTAEGFQVTFNETGTCRQGFTYTLFGGSSCRVTQTGSFNFQTPLTNIRAFGLSNISCENGIISGRIAATVDIPQCSEIEISVIEMPPGVTSDEVSIVANSSGSTIFQFSAPAGNYTFLASITNMCGQVSSTFSIGCPIAGDCDRIPQEFIVRNRSFCGSLADLTQVDLPLRHFDNARYEVSVSEKPDWLEVDVSVMGSTAVANFTVVGTPDDADRSVNFDILIFDELNPDCPPRRQSIGIRLVNPPDPIVNDVLNINCGVGSILSLFPYHQASLVSRYRIFDFPAGYTGLTRGRLNDDSQNILQLSQLGTYRIERRIIRGQLDDFLSRTISCSFFDTLTIIVDDIPTINAGSDALTCADNIQLNGSTPRNAAGNVVDIDILWEPVEDYPGVTISDPTIRNPVVRGLQPDREYTFRYAFPGSPDCEKEDHVTISVKGDCDDVVPPLTCEMELDVRCTLCGCGDQLFVAEVRNSNGDPFTAGTFTIDWFINGEPFDGQNFNYISAHYDGPSVVTALVVFELANGDKCTIERSKAVTCGDDCPEVSFEYATDDCGNGYFYGEVTVVDQAGNPVTTAGIDWYADGATETNPYQVYVPSGDNVLVVVDFYSPQRCVQEVKFAPDCGKDETGYSSVAGGKNLSQANSSLQIYPNPAQKNQQLVIRFGELAPVNLVVTDLTGREVLRKPLPEGASDHTLAAATLPGGVFVAILYGKQGELLSARRFVVR